MKDDSNCPPPSCTIFPLYDRSQLLQLYPILDPSHENLIHAVDKVSEVWEMLVQ